MSEDILEVPGMIGVAYHITDGGRNQRIRAALAAWGMSIEPDADDKGYTLRVPDNFRVFAMAEPLHIPDKQGVKLEVFLVGIPTELGMTPTVLLMRGSDEQGHEKWGVGVINAANFAPSLPFGKKRRRHPPRNTYH